jgi:hypothetical protein
MKVRSPEAANLLLPSLYWIAPEGGAEQDYLLQMPSQNQPFKPL